MNYIKYPNSNVRQSSAYGLGLLVKFLGENLKTCFNDLMNSYVNMINTPMTSNEIQHIYNTSKENGVSSYGKTMKIMWNDLD